MQQGTDSTQVLPSVTGKGVATVSRVEDHYVFSEASVEERIEVGHRDAAEQGIERFMPTRTEIARVQDT